MYVLKYDLTALHIVLYMNVLKYDLSALNIVLYMCVLKPYCSAICTHVHPDNVPLKCKILFGFIALNPIRHSDP
jgi:hypothetical protein